MWGVGKQEKIGQQINGLLKKLIKRPKIYQIDILASVQYKKQNKNIKYILCNCVYPQDKLNIKHKLHAPNSSY